MRTEDNDEANRSDAADHNAGDAAALAEAAAAAAACRRGSRCGHTAGSISARHLPQVRKVEHVALAGRTGGNTVPTEPIRTIGKVCLCLEVRVKASAPTPHILWGLSGRNIELTRRLDGGGSARRAGRASEGVGRVRRRLAEQVLEPGLRLQLRLDRVPGHCLVAEQRAGAGEPDERQLLGQ